MGATPYRPLSCVTTNSKAAITTTAMSAIVIAISIAPPGWSSVSNRLYNAAHQARTLLPPHRIGALPYAEYSHKNYSAEGCIQPVTNGLARPAHPVEGFVEAVR